MHLHHNSPMGQDSSTRCQQNPPYMQCMAHQTSLHHIQTIGQMRTTQMCLNQTKQNKTKTHDQIDWVGLYKISKMPNIPTFLRKFESTCQPQVIYTKGKKRLRKNTLSVHREKNCPPYQSDSKKIFLSNKFLENLI